MYVMYIMYTYLTLIFFIIFKYIQVYSSNIELQAKHIQMSY